MVRYADGQLNRADLSVLVLTADMMGDMAAVVDAKRFDVHDKDRTW